MNPPIVYELTTPSIHSTTNTRKTVQSIASSDENSCRVRKHGVCQRPGAWPTYPGVQNEYSGLPRDVVFGHRGWRFRFGDRRIVDLTRTSLARIRDAFVARLREAYARAERRPAEDRRWLPGLPGWWTPTFTVEQRRRLSAAERSRMLRYRQAA